MNRAWKEHRYYAANCQLLTPGWRLYDYDAQQPSRLAPPSCRSSEVALVSQLTWRNAPCPSLPGNTGKVAGADGEPSISGPTLRISERARARRDLWRPARDVDSSSPSFHECCCLLSALEPSSFARSVLQTRTACGPPERSINQPGRTARVKPHLQGRC